MIPWSLNFVLLLVLWFILFQKFGASKEKKEIISHFIAGTIFGLIGLIAGVLSGLDILSIMTLKQGNYLTFLFLNGGYCFLGLGLLGLLKRVFNLQNR